MSETLVEENTEKDIYGITPEVREKYRKKLEEMIRGRYVKVFTEKDFDFPKDKETQAKIRAEVDEFLQMLEESRKENRERDFD